MAAILITHGIPAEGLSPLEGHRLIMPPPRGVLTRDEMARLLPEADAMIACGPMDAEMIHLGKRLKIIANYGAGYDRIDLVAAAACGIPVTNIPEVTANATAELAIGLMLAVSRRIGEMTLRLRREDPPTLFGLGVAMGRTLRGQTLGILGLGRIGTRVAELGRALGMEVIGVNRHGVDPAAAQPVTMAELLETSDVLSLHCPLTPETRNILNRDAIGRMKRNAIVINTSRGGVADYDALADALESGRLSGAGLDVFPDEPHIPARLLALPQVVATPHVGTNTIQTRREMASACALQVLDALAGRKPKNIVNGL